MKVVILCGGYGMRIRDVSENMPKPMIPIGGLPILMHIMKYYAHYGFKEFILCLGYKGDVIKDFFLNYEARTRDFTIQLGRGGGNLEFHSDHMELDWRVTLADTGLQAMTGARIRKIQPYLGNEDLFMLTYGDGVGDIDLSALLAFHRSHDRILTVTGVRPPGRFGELVKGDGGRVIEFNEKPQATAGLISGGFFVCRRGLFKYIDGGDDVFFEQDPMRSLVRDQQMMVYEHNGFWQPMDTHRDFQLLNTLYDSGKAPWVIWR